MAISVEGNTGKYTGGLETCRKCGDGIIFRNLH
jgi:hypothetical protein